MRVLLLGAGGMLGHDLVATAPPHLTVLPRSRSELDITDHRTLTSEVSSMRPNIIVNAAAYTAVDSAELEPDIPFRVNGEALHDLGSLAARIGCKIVHVSTDYIFDGEASRPYREDDEPSPLGVYGASKLMGERALQASGAEYLLIRTQWLFGFHKRSFPRTMWERARAGVSTKVVNDQTGRPTYSRDLAYAVWRLLRTNTSVLHVTNSGEAVTWFGIAQRVFARVGRPDLVSPCMSAEYRSAAKRPMYSLLDTQRFDTLHGSLPTWTSALERFLTELETP